MNKTIYDDAIAYFEDAIRESDEIIALEDCGSDLEAALKEQQGHFVTALDALRAVQEGKSHAGAL